MGSDLALAKIRNSHLKVALEAVAVLGIAKAGLKELTETQFV